jgi:hypothetical protein
MEIEQRDLQLQYDSGTGLRHMMVLFRYDKAETYLHSPSEVHVWY